MSHLPEVASDDDVDALRKDVTTCRNAIAAAARREGLPEADEATFFEDGSALVGAAGNFVIKMFAPFDHELMTTEHRVLTAIDSNLSCPTPQLDRVGTFEGWPYLVMTRLPGVPLSTVWQDLPLPEKQRLCRNIGRTAAELHDLPTTALQDLPPQWSPFIVEQRETAVTRQTRHPIDPAWLARIEPFLAQVSLTDEAPVLLHTELMRGHFLTEQRGDRWELSGLVDFEPAMLGHREYDFSSIGLFVTSGEPTLLGHLLQEYGYADSDLDSAFQQRALAYTLLHRYSCLAWYFQFMPMEGLDTLEQIAERWWQF